MTSAGFSRLATIFVNDVDRVEYTVDGSPQSKTISSFNVANGRLNMFISIPNTENGSFANFNVIASTGITYTERTISFEKTQDGIQLNIPFNFLNG